MRSDSLADRQGKLTEYQDNGAQFDWFLDAPESVSADPEPAGLALDLARIWKPGF
jgi:hypothetical protein